MPSLPEKLAETTLSSMRLPLGLTEVHGAPDAPYLTLKSAMSPAPVGWVRLFRGKRVPRVINVGLVVPAIGLDSHMIFAFTPKDSAIPHFTLDSVKAPEFFAFHLDLIPRVDLGANVAYMNSVYHPLTEIFAEVGRLEGLSPAKLTPRQNALMSPWMLAYRATEPAFGKIGPFVSGYLTHWLHQVEKGLPADAAAGIDGASLAERDRRNRAALFSPEIDPVWNNVDRLLGSETSARLRELLKDQSEAQ